MKRLALVGKADGLARQDITPTFLWLKSIILRECGTNRSYFAGHVRYRLGR
ncbi:hypothetical protein Cha6605_4755 [Chamaesiphon minutus PCC 6605]|uniref:Uncharacterized protein n=1 Tax=Chamaesiphon minutus (strain ATCC 27169 / PCC 6605) TaxID=1173020 RepID=K9ULH1_CHAP6|nr:hypothetical protein Cha6605_4755 [Chamaesiphon minutus PCC 6605]